MRQLPVKERPVSRYQFRSAEGITWAVGFDPALASYFAQEESADNDLVDVAGSDVGEVGTAAALHDRLAGLVSIPADIAEALETDGPTHPEWLRPDLAQERIDAIEKGLF